MRNIKLLTILFFLSQFLFTQEREKIDGVAAVIGDFVVLESDIDKQLHSLEFLAFQWKIFQNVRC